MLKAIITKHYQARLRHAMRGHRHLRDTGRLASIEDVCAKLLRAPIDNTTPHFSALFFGPKTQHLELAAHQYIYLRLCLYKLAPKLLELIGNPDKKLSYPLPSAWQKILIEHGFSVNRFTCTLQWIGLLAAYCSFGAIYTIRLLLIVAVSSLSGTYKNAKPFSHFENIDVVHTPRPAADGPSHDIMSWYLKWDGHATNVQSLSYRVRTYKAARRDKDVFALKTPALPILNIQSWLRIAAWAVFAVPYAAVHIFTGRWWYALLLSEAAMARFVRHVPQKAVAQDYMMNISGWLYRPLWTYVAEDRGARILIYHYSTNSAKAKTADGYPPEHHTWNQTNWPLHLVWNTEHANFVRRAIPGANVQIVGSIWFSSSPEPLEIFPSPAIAVFDVQPFRPARYAMLADEFNYYTAETCLAFLQDVARACDEAGFHMVWKRKRNIGAIAHPKYRKLADHLEESQNLSIAPATQSAIRVIESCNAVISLPFTSTALLGEGIGKPTCYYDPTGLLQKDDRSAHGITFIQGYDELAIWVKALKSAQTDNYQDSKGTGSPDENAQF